MTPMDLHYVHLISTALAFVAFAVSIAAYVRLPSVLGSFILSFGTTIIIGWAFVFATPTLFGVTADDQLASAAVILFMAFTVILTLLHFLDRVQAPAARDPHAPRGIEPPQSWAGKQ